LEIIQGDGKIAGTQRKRNIDPLNEALLLLLVARWRLVVVLYATLQADPEMVCELEKAK